MRLPILLLTAFSVGCGIAKPNTNLCIVNARGETRKCYNLHDDYDDEGRLKAGAKPKYFETKTVMDLDKNACTDPDGLAELKAYIKKLRVAFEEECK